MKLPPPEKTCFVISPIGDPGSEERIRADRVFKHIVAPAAASHQLQAVRSDQISSPGAVISNEVIQHILNDQVVVADLTGRNPNVFYELGLRHSFRKPVVQMISQGERLPFDVQGTRVVYYALDLDGAAGAQEEVRQQIAEAIEPGFEAESPVTFAARAAQIDKLTESARPQNQLMIKEILEQINSLRRQLSTMSEAVCRPQDIRESVPPIIREQIADTLRSYAEEIRLLKAVRYAGIVGIYRRREQAIRYFGRAIDEETREITVVGSSLKGLLQKEEFTEIAEKLRFKTDNGLVTVKFLLTHPIVADFRARQENRPWKEIGLEIIKSLDKLRQWNPKYCRVKLYVGAPTCFAIKTSRKMLINPYAYRAVCYDSPCLIIESSQEGGADRPGYFFDDFDTGHFSAWDTDLAIEVSDLEKTVRDCKTDLQSYSDTVEKILNASRSRSASV